MFSVVFPGQGSQFVGMGRKLYNEFSYIKDLFHQADDILNYPLSKIILDGPKEKLDSTENTQPSIFLVSFSIYNVIKKETNIDLSKAKFFAGHSLGEYSALACSGSLIFEQTIKLLNLRGKAMQSAVPKGEGGMLAILGVEIDKIKNILDENKSNYECFIANDNSKGQIVISGKNQDLENLMLHLKKLAIKNIKLPVSAPFHCKLMKTATEEMKNVILNTDFKKPNNLIVSNVTSEEVLNPEDIKKLLIKQIENSVRWRESIIYMSNKGVRKFIEIGPGKVLSGLIKRIDKNISMVNINDIDDLKNLNIDD